MIALTMQLIIFYRIFKKTVKQMPIFSVIIPVYKCEPFLKRCLESILSQSFEDWEAILIDDGSPDNSGKICDEYAARDSRFKVIHKPNSGVSDTRNKGLDVSNGEFIVFIDSDDWIGPNYLASFAAHLEYDLILSGYHRFGAVDSYNYGKEEKAFDDMKDFVTAWKDLFDKTQRSISGLTFPWGKAMRASIIHDAHLRFDSEMKYGEDACFVYEYMILARNAIVIKGNEYHYYTPNIPHSNFLSLEGYQHHCHYFCDVIKRIEDKYGFYAQLAADANCVGAFNRYWASYDAMSLSQVEIASSVFLKHNQFNIFPLIEKIEGEKKAKSIRFLMIHPVLNYCYRKCTKIVKNIVRKLK